VTNAVAGRNFGSLTTGDALRTGTVRAPEDSSNVPNKANPNAGRSAFKTGNNPDRNRASHRAPNASRKVRR
jgi:hypothetical protein